MANTTRRRGHAAASARILTAGLSSAAAFGMVAGMAISSTGGQGAAPLAPLGPTLAAATPVFVAGSTAQPVASPAPVTATPATLSRPAARAKPRPVTRTRAS